MKTVVLNTIMRGFMEFMTVGGMPEAVSKYLDDVVESEVMRIRKTLELIPH